MLTLPPRPALALSIAMLVCGACRDSDVTTYRIPKEAAIAGAAPTSGAGPAALVGPSSERMAETAVPTAAGGGLVWSAPAQWQAKPSTAMRKGTYLIAGPDGTTAELAITAFPGDVGGEAANVNRWRGQLQLEPLSADEMEHHLSRDSRNGLTITIVDFANNASPAQRILGAIVPVGGSTWFFKLMGADAFVARERAPFLAFLETVKPSPLEP